jgi:integrase
VFRAPAGGPLRGNGFRRRVWQPATLAAGLSRLRIHDLRHTAVTLWIAFVLDRYGQRFPESDAALRDRLEVLFRAATEQRRNTAG